MTTQAADGGSATGGTEGSASGTQPATTIKPEDHQRALDDMKKFKSEARANADRIAALEAEIAKSKNESLEKNQEYKTLFEQEKQRAEKALLEKEEIKKSLLLTEKHRAVFPALKKLGLRDDAEKLLDPEDLSDLEVEATSNGRFIVNGVDGWAQNFLAQHPYAFAQAKPPVVNPGGGAAGGGANGKITAEMVNELETASKKDPKNVEKRQAHIKAHEAFLKQRAKRA